MAAEPAFEAGSLPAALAARKQIPARPTRIGHSVYDVLCSGLAPDPSDRPQAEELRAALVEAADREVPTWQTAIWLTQEDPTPWFGGAPLTGQGQQLMFRSTQGTSTSWYRVFRWAGSRLEELPPPGLAQSGNVAEYGWPAASETAWQCRQDGRVIEFGQEWEAAMPAGPVIATTWRWQNERWHELASGEVPDEDRPDEDLACPLTRT